MALLLLLVVLSAPAVLAQISIQGCPMWGCSSQGTFSILMDNPPMRNVSVTWKKERGGGGPELPPPQGCSSDGDSVVCLVPGPTSNEVGFEAPTGDALFTDKELRAPTMPLIALGGLTFSMDKGHLQCRLPNGTMRGRSIPLTDFPGVYNLVVSDDGFLLITVPIWGLLVVYLTAGVPHASIYLDETVAGINGTFLPIAQPVIDGQKAYFLTKFGKSHWKKPSPDPYPVEYRLYRVDLTTQMAPRMVVRWYYPLVPNSHGNLVPKDPVIIDSNYSGGVSGSNAREYWRHKRWEWTPALSNVEDVDQRFGKFSSSEKVGEGNKADLFWEDIIKLVDKGKTLDGLISNQNDLRKELTEQNNLWDKLNHDLPNPDPFNIYRNLLLADNGRIYVSFIVKDVKDEQAILPQLFLFKESPNEGKPPTVVKSISDSVASLAMRQKFSSVRASRSTTDCTKGDVQPVTYTIEKSAKSPNEDKRYLWSLMGHDVLVALDPDDLSYVRTANLSELLGTKLKVTSKIMVLWSGGSGSAFSAKEVLIFGVTFERPPNRKNVKPILTCNEKETMSESGSFNYVVALDQHLNVLWTLVVPDDSPVVGQMAGYSSPSDDGLVFAVSEKGTVFAIKG